MAGEKAHNSLQSDAQNIAQRADGGHKPDGAAARPYALVLCNEMDNDLLPDAAFENAGCTVVRASHLEAALTLLPDVMPRLVFTSLEIDNKATLPLVNRTMANLPGAVVVVMAENDQINSAAEAMHQGAYDCLFKPFSEARLTRTIEAALRSGGGAGGDGPPPARRLTPAVETRVSMSDPVSDFATPRTSFGAANAAQTRGGPAFTRETPSPRSAHTFHGMIGQSAAMRGLFRRVEAVAPSRAAVLIRGDVGSGKSMLAKVIHAASNRADKALVMLDCAVINPQSFEAELLGRPATDHAEAQPGALARAAGGTLVLERIEELPAPLQSRLVPLVQSGDLASFKSAMVPSGNLRIIATLSEAPHEAIARGALREDLFYSLNVAAIELPKLRDRTGDAPLIAQAQLDLFLAQENRPDAAFSPEALTLLEAYDWPGNVRELLNLVWGLALTNEDRVIGPEAISLPRQLFRAPPDRRTGVEGDETADVTGLLGQSLADIERIVIEATIAQQGGSVPRAARVLDVSPSTIYRKREAWMRGNADS